MCDAWCTNACEIVRSVCDATTRYTAGLDRVFVYSFESDQVSRQKSERQVDCDSDSSPSNYAVAFKHHGMMSTKTGPIIQLLDVQR